MFMLQGVWNPGSLEQPHAQMQLQRSLSSPGKIKNTGTFTKLRFFCGFFFHILIKAWLKFQGGGDMANIFNVRSGHGFVGGGRSCGGSAGCDAL